MKSENNAVFKTGRRKTSTAQVKMTPGNGKITVNSKPAEDYFKSCARFKTNALLPISAVKTAEEYDYLVKVRGGGISGQAGAVRHAIARAVAGLGEDAKKTVKKAGFLTRDARMVERKKPGQPKARKRFQFSKR